MESTLGSSTALTFRGGVSWLALRSIGLSGRISPRTTTGGHSSNEASSKSEGCRSSRDESLLETRVFGPKVFGNETFGGGRRFRKASSFSRRRGISRRKGAAAARRASTLRSERDRDEGCSRIGEVGDKVGLRAIAARCPRATRCQSTLHGGPGLARRGRLVTTSRSNQGLHARRLACGPRGLGCAHGRARGWTRLQESVSDVWVVRPEVMSLGIVRKGSRATLVGRMRGHRR